MALYFPDSHADQSIATLEGMKKLLTLLGMAVAMFSQTPPKPGDAKKITDAEELQQFIKENAGVYFLDVREPKEIAELGSLKGYVNIPIGELEKRMKEIPKDRTIVTL